MSIRSFAAPAALLLVLASGSSAWAQDPEPDLQAIVCAAADVTVGELVAANAGVEAQLRAFIGPFGDDAPIVDVQAVKGCEAQPTTPVPTPDPDPPTTTTPPPLYEDCTAARAAGAAPIAVGDPGYRVELDRDGDGSACEIDEDGSTAAPGPSVPLPDDGDVADSVPSGSIDTGAW